MDLVEDNQLPRQVSRAMGEEFAKQMNAQFFETSSKVNKNVAEVFHHIGTSLQARRQLQPSSPSKAPPISSTTVELEASAAPPASGMRVVDWLIGCIL